MALRSNTTTFEPSIHRGGSAENERPENDGQRKLEVWKMTDRKMTEEQTSTERHACIARYDACSNTKLQFLHAVSPISHSLGVNSATFRAETTSDDNGVNGDQQQQTESTPSLPAAFRAAKAPVYKLLKSRFCGFSPRMGDTLHRWGEIWHGGVGQSSSVPNFTHIGATIRAMDPQNWNFYWDLIKM